MIGRDYAARRARGGWVDIFQVEQQDILLRDEHNMVNLRNSWKVKLEPTVQREEWREVRLGKELGRTM